ncbi:hypothetical protein AB0J74_23105 [Asanoa sp. NPDC049573]|uniref:hypothetical protein n=1 Tax=Asanoa sp. NPDC049573 TaxID=3155396 RepID=UPI003420CDE6
MRRDGPDDERRRQGLADARAEVAHLQWTARRNFRWSVAFGCVFFGLLGLWSLIAGDDPAPNVLMLVGGVAALVTFTVRSWLLLGAAAALCVAGLVWILA